MAPAARVAARQGRPLSVHSVAAGNTAQLAPAWPCRHDSQDGTGITCAAAAPRRPLGSGCPPPGAGGVAGSLAGAAAVHQQRRCLQHGTVGARAARASTARRPRRGLQWAGGAHRSAAKAVAPRRAGPLCGEETAPTEKETNVPMIRQVHSTRLSGLPLPKNQGADPLARDIVEPAKPRPMPRQGVQLHQSTQTPRGKHHHCHKDMTAPTPQAAGPPLRGIDSALPTTRYTTTTKERKSTPRRQRHHHHEGQTAPTPPAAAELRRGRDNANVDATRTAAPTSLGPQPCSRHHNGRMGEKTPTPRTAAPPPRGRNCALPTAQFTTTARKRQSPSRPQHHDHHEGQTARTPVVATRLRLQTMPTPLPHVPPHTPARGHHPPASTTTPQPAPPRPKKRENAHPADSSTTTPRERWRPPHSPMHHHGEEETVPVPPTAPRPPRGTDSAHPTGSSTTGPRDSANTDARCTAAPGRPQVPPRRQSLRRTRQAAAATP